MIGTTLEKFESYEQYLDDHMSDGDLSTWRTRNSLGN